LLKGRMRLTADLILRSPTYLNPLKEREIDLRGNKIAVIENLGASQDQFDSFDLSDNELTKLEGFPLLQRLRTLLLNNNLIGKIGSNLGEALPKLDTLVLTNNRLNNLSDVDPLAEIRTLQRLSLLDNLITKKQHYRLYVVHKLPQLKILDYRKVKQKERLAASKLFGNESQHKNSASKHPQEATPSSASLFAHHEQMRLQETQAIKSAIANAATIEEVSNLERALAAGQIPKSH